MRATPSPECRGDDSGVREVLIHIRINDQFRVCFKGEEKVAYDVEIVEHH